MPTVKKDKPINLATVEGEKLFDERMKSTRIYDPHPANLDNYLATGNFELVYGKGVGVISSDDDYVFLVKDKMIRRYDFGHCQFPTIGDGEEVKKTLKYTPTAFLIESEKRTDITKSDKLFLLLNGDSGYNDFVEAYSGRWPTISFRCLCRFYDKGKGVTEKVEQLVAKRLCAGKIALVDFIEDEVRVLSKEEMKTFTQKGCDNLKPPAPGFTLIKGDRWGGSNTHWHRPATALLYDQDLQATYLMGTDEDAYFGVELADNPKTIGDAYKSLMPPEVRSLSPTTYCRQGEWFAVPVKKVPPVTECLAEFTELALPVEHKDSNRHRIDALEGLISKTGQIFARQFRVQHPDHEDMEMMDWATFYRNTAKRSFSEEGVD
jgi:hypothetical protein